MLPKCHAVLLLIWLRTSPVVESASPLSVIKSLGRNRRVPIHPSSHEKSKSSSSSSSVEEEEKTAFLWNETSNVCLEEERHEKNLGINGTFASATNLTSVVKGSKPGKWEKRLQYRIPSKRGKTTGDVSMDIRDEEEDDYMYDANEYDHEEGEEDDYMYEEQEWEDGEEEEGEEDEYWDDGDYGDYYEEYGEDYDEEYDESYDEDYDDENYNEGQLDEKSYWNDDDDFDYESFWAFDEEEDDQDGENFMEKCHSKTEHKRCQSIDKKEEECNEQMMMATCPISCGVCSLMEQSRDMGVRQNLLGTTNDDVYKTVTYFKQVQNYLMQWRVKSTTPIHLIFRPNNKTNRNHNEEEEEEEVEVIDENDQISKQAKCMNRDALCTYWASLGANHDDGCYGSDHIFMVNNCAAACQFCHFLDPETSCALPGSAHHTEVPAIQVGYWRNMVDRIMKDFQHLEPEILTEPSWLQQETQQGGQEVQEEDVLEDYDEAWDYNEEEWWEEQDEETKRADKANKQNQSPPWILTLNSFLTPQECRHLIQIGARKGFEASRYHGDEILDEDGNEVGHQTEGRTSSSAWVHFREDPVVRRVMNRIVDVTGIPARYSEDFQLLKYEEGQFYETHHDSAEDDRDLIPAGNRILTVFLYLNDVAEGGGTMFNKLSVSRGKVQGDEGESEWEDFIVTPQMGKALIWTNLQDNNQRFSRNELAFHEALPVTKGRKYAANVWYHMYDFQAPFYRMCPIE